MIDTNDGLTQGDFRMLAGQMWHHFERNEKDRAASFLVLLEVSLSDEQTDEMVELLGGKVYEELAGRGAVISERLQVLRLDPNTLTLVRVVRDNNGQILHMEQYFRFIAQYVEGIVALLDQADYALTQAVLGAGEEMEQSKRYGLGRSGWESLHSQPRPIDWAVLPATATNPTMAAMDVPSKEDASSGDDVSSLDILLEQLDAAFAADCAPAICLADWLSELEAEEEQLVWQRYPRRWLERMIEATEEDRTEMRVLRRGDDQNAWLHLTDCTYNRQGVLIGYTDDTFYAPDLEAMSAYLQDCRQALKLAIVDAFDFNPQG